MDYLDQISLSSVYKRKKSDRDIFEELMPSKVKEVLLVATLYDSYSIVREGQFSDKIFGEYLQLNLYSAPRFTSVSSSEDALVAIRTKHFDLVIIMAGVDRTSPLVFAQKIHEEKQRLPILLLVNNNVDLVYFTQAAKTIPSIDRVFVWNGNSTVFLAMMKYIEDKKNVARDTKNGNVRVILLVEDSERYYSRYLPLLYSSIMTQTQNLVSDESTDELHMILKMRARPKILLAGTYEEAIDIISNYKDYLLCVISDVKFSRNGIDDENAGIDLLRLVKQMLRFPVPILLQSHDQSNEAKAKAIGADFINKNSESLSMDIHNFIYRRLGFGDFVFRNPDGTPIAVARTMNEFEALMKSVPIASIIYHGKQNAFSTWLMARGEINIAEQLLPYQIDDFNDLQEVRHLCLTVFERVREKRLRGKIVLYEPGIKMGNRYILRLGNGSLGGKGRGLAFLSNFMENIDFKKIIPKINIRIPATAIIGAQEFDKFIENNNLYSEIYHGKDFNHIKELFLKSKLSDELRDKLRHCLQSLKKPLAIRSSGLFEDTLMQPFAGVYETFLIPNNHPDINVRFDQLITAIKLVYASIFTRSSHSYFDAVNYKIEEERMAIIIQEVVGHNYNDRFYPHISGVAQSYNYYPFSYMKPEDGFSVAAVGLGMYVVGGEKSYRFCPRYPELNHNSLADQVRDSQKEFYAIDMTREEFDLKTDGEFATVAKYKIREAEKDGTLNHCVSTYDSTNDRLIAGLNGKGPKVVDFANILKYQQIPLADTLRFLLRLFREAMGTSVEIEYAVDLTPDDRGNPTFYVLQLKPLIRSDDQVDIEPEKINKEQALMISHRGMGNGKLKAIKDVVYVMPDSFDRTKTLEIAEEIEILNQQFLEKGENYVLIGPGRWGTRDRFTGIPVLWTNISQAKLIVEMGLKDFPLDASLGSHFFHNVTSMNVGYFSVPYESDEFTLCLDKLEQGRIISRGNYTCHVHFDQDLKIMMDGRKGMAVVLIPK